MILSYNRAFNDLLSDLHRRVLPAFPAPWADGGILDTPNYIFDIYLSDITFYDIISIRFGRQIFEADMIYSRYPQSQDSYAHHIYAYHIFGGKSVLHNMIRDEIYRILYERNLHYKLESNQLLPDSSDQRPADILTIPIALWR